MIPKQAIEKAIEGGFEEGRNWKFVSANRYWVCWLDGNGTVTPISTSLYIISPDFWQALGKALGWGTSLYVGRMVRLSGDELKGDKWELPIPEYYAHRFYDLILNGGNVEAFWKELLATHK